MTYEVKGRREREGKRDIKIDGGEGISRGREGGGGRGREGDPARWARCQCCSGPHGGCTCSSLQSPRLTRALEAVPLMHLSTWAR